MNKTAIKNFAIWARNKLIADIQYRAGLMGITADGIKNALPQSTPNMEFYDIGTAEPYSITSEAIQQRKKLVEVLRQKEKDSDYPTAYKYILEEVAYTWFNRLIAIRFMEVNDYLPSHIRVLSSESGKVEPDLVTTPFDAELDFTPAEEETILRLKNENALDALFRLLFIKQCNALNEILPALFEKTSDYTELLLNLSVVDQDGVVYHLTHDIDEDDFNIEKGGQVEIIGWMYQYYNTEPKNAAFSKNGKITKDEIPAVTQLFTPDWIVRYMIQNSLGRLFINKRKNEGVFADGRGLDEMTWDEVENKRIANEEFIADQMGWKYYLPEAAQTREVRQQLDEIQQQSAYKDVRDIKVIDPCMGSGHILVYAFDVLMQMYEDAGYSQRDAAKSILENNLYGLDIDDRAYQLAYFAVMMKARQYNRRILNGETPCHVYSIQESNNINRAHLKYLGAGMDELEVNTARVQLDGLLDTLRDAKEYGSILKVKNYNWELLRRFVSAADAGEQISMDNAGLEGTVEQLLTLIDTAETMAQKYWVTCTNPPYAVVSKLSDKVSSFVKQAYPYTKADLFACFVERGFELTYQYGYLSMITMESWMFISTFEEMRTNVIFPHTIMNLVHMPYLGKGGTSLGINFGTAAFVMLNRNQPNFNAQYEYTVYYECDDDGVPFVFPTKNQRWKTARKENFSKIPGSPLSYWVSSEICDVYSNSLVKNHMECKSGIMTGDDRYIRLWTEISTTNLKLDCRSADDMGEYRWFPLNSGGDFRYYYGNNSKVVNLWHDGFDIKANVKNYRLRDKSYYFKKGITWGRITSSKIAFREVVDGSLFGDAGPIGFIEQHREYLLGFLCSKVALYFLEATNPTLNYQVRDIENLPLLINEKEYRTVTQYVTNSISVSKSDWDSFETSWDFQQHPLIRPASTVADAFAQWEAECKDRFKQLKTNEEELNRIFIGIYGLQEDLTPEVEDKDVTVRKADLQRDIKSLLSYAVGCMFGRYSLDMEGLVFAGGDWDERNYKTFLPDVDGILPITDEEYLGDDIVTRLCSWLKVVYGEDTLEENLDFIAKALETKGKSSREIIRNYFLRDFFKDHSHTYSVTGFGRRPIYWLFDSGKQNGFKALIYLHRYTPDTIGNLRVDYLHKMQRVYESEIGRMQDMIDHSTNAREVAAATKRKEKLQKQLKECRDYDEMIAHLALSRIELDLDDGVKVNYEKIQTASDGRKYPVLAKI